jgi:N-acetylglutamate synthase-like GNAT family acetyltransferase
METALETPPKTVTLPSGLRVVVRLLGPADRQGLLELFACSTPDDRQYFRDDVTDAALVSSWAEHVDLDRVIPLVAEVNGRLAGQGTLHRGRGYNRHVAEVRIFVCREFRGRGVGTALVEGLLDVARQIGLHHVFILAVSSRPQDMRAFEALGFRTEGALTDRFMDAAGNTYDMIEMALPLKREAAY